MATVVEAGRLPRSRWRWWGEGGGTGGDCADKGVWCRWEVVVFLVWWCWEDFRDSSVGDGGTGGGGGGVGTGGD